MRGTIILIHGYGFDQRTWLPVELAFDGFDIIRFSLPGFNSETPQGPYTIASLAKQYWDAIDPVKHPAVHLVGHSMGGYVCIEMVAQQPSRVASLAMIHSHVFEDSPEKKSQRTITMGGIRADGRSSFVKKMIPSLFADAAGYPGLVGALVLRAMEYDDLAWYYGAQALRERKDHRETLKQLEVPVLMISGDNDQAVPSQLMYQQAHLSTKTTLHIYPDVGHMGMYENTSRMTEDLISFYDEMDAGREGT